MLLMIKCGQQWELGHLLLTCIRCSLLSLPSLPLSLHKPLEVESTAPLLSSDVYLYIYTWSVCIAPVSISIIACVLITSVCMLLGHAESGSEENSLQA